MCTSHHSFKIDFLLQQFEPYLASLRTNNVLLNDHIFCICDTGACPYANNHLQYDQ
ncbi:hypothetical protein KSS87_009168, partial [Heliosperma pusillum]